MGEERDPVHRPGASSARSTNSADFARNDKYVDGGAAAVAATDFRDSPKGLFASPPKCYMHRQASFIPSFFPEGTKLGEDADFFYFPAYAGKDLGKPVLGAGTLAMITKDGQAARAFIEFLKTPLAHEIWMAQSGFLTPLKSANAEAYAKRALKKQGEILLNATTFRFDGSDLMPGKIGAGAFWTGMVDYAGGKPAADVAADIQKAGTPSSKILRAGSVLTSSMARRQSGSLRPALHAAVGTGCAAEGPSACCQQDR